MTSVVTVNDRCLQCTIGLGRLVWQSRRVGWCSQFENTFSTFFKIQKRDF